MWRGRESVSYLSYIHIFRHQKLSQYNIPRIPGLVLFEQNKISKFQQFEEFYNYAIWKESTQQVFPKLVFQMRFEIILQQTVEVSVSINLHKNGFSYLVLNTYWFCNMDVGTAFSGTHYDTWYRLYLEYLTKLLHTTTTLYQYIVLVCQNQEWIFNN